MEQRMLPNFEHRKQYKKLQNMKCLAIVFQGSYALLALCLGAAGYIYVVHGLGGDTVMGVLALGITGIFAAMLYRLGGWFVREALPQLERIYARRREIRAAAKAATANVPVSVEDSVWAKISAYTQCIFKKHLPEVEIERLLTMLDNLRSGVISDGAITRPLVQANGLTVTDLFHYGWNVWARTQLCSRRRMCSFLRQAFPNMLGHIAVETIYSKMTKDYGPYSIPLVEVGEKLC